jgi:hypothetical protein
MDTDAAWQIPVGNDPTLHRGSLVNIFKVSSSLCRLLCWDSYRLCQSLRDGESTYTTMLIFYLLMLQARL